MGSRGTIPIATGVVTRPSENGGERLTPMSPRILEEAAITVLAHVVRESGPIREQLLFEQRRFERLVHIIHCLPNRGGER
jgi:hypothetical protein